MEMISSAVHDRSLKQITNDLKQLKIRYKALPNTNSDHAKSLLVRIRECEDEINRIYRDLRRINQEDWRLSKIRMWALITNLVLCIIYLLVASYK